MMAFEGDYVAQTSSSSSLSSRKCLMWQSRSCWILFVAYSVLCFPIAMKSCLCLDEVPVTRQQDACIFCRDFGSSVYDQQGLEAYYVPGDVCSCSGSFSFQSSLVDFLGEEHGGRAPSQTTIRNAAFKMANDEVISCLLKHSASGLPLRQSFENWSMAAERVDFCEGSVVPDICMNGSGGPNSDLDEGLDEEEVVVLIGSSSFPEIEISPSTLDWGTRTIYSPSLVILKVFNKHNESVLNMYDIYSTNKQFSAYSFQKFSVAPGEFASIPFVFLPRWLGSSSAQLVFQTSFGGFIIRAEGIATMSPYKLQPLVGFNISTGKRLGGNLSLHNPSIDRLYVKEVSTWISISNSKKKYHSARVSCRTDKFQKYHIQSDSLVDGEWFSLKNGELGPSRVDFRPLQQWEVPPYSSKTILELNLWPHLAGKVSGAICVKVGNSLQETETIILPIDIEVHEKESYTNPSGSVSLQLDTLSPCHWKKSIFSISLRNDASYLLSIVKINEEAKSCKIFEIRYTEGLLLFPGTVTRIALITYNHPLFPKAKVNQNHSTSLTCMLTIRTNDSVNPEISIPCQDVVMSSCLYQSGFHNIDLDGAYIKMISKQKYETCSSNQTLSLGNIDEELSPFKTKSSEITESDMLLDKWRSQATTSLISVLEDQKLLFPVVQVGSHYSKWIAVHNPSRFPIVMQLVLNSGAVIDHCKLSNDLAEHAFMAKSSRIDSTEIRVGFSMAEHAITEAFVHPLERALFGPVIFHPSNRCMWRSSALIRNNLSGVELLPIQAFGGSQALVILEDSVPIHRLDFDLRVLKTSNVSSIESSGSLCNNQLSKELHAKNIGELPLEVIKLKVSGTDCRSDGFSIHSCKGFALAPGESRNLLISYQSDFSTAVVLRDLELSMATGILVIPMKASVPVHILNMCRKAFFRSMHWKLFLLPLLVSFVLFHLMIRIVPRFNPPLHQINSRSLREDEKFEASFFNQYPESTHDFRYNAKRVSKECFDHHKNHRLPPQLGNSLAIVTSDTPMLEIPENCNLTVRIGREKGKRRKRRSSGAGLAAKFDVSSSQSGNSTPSSPLSPNISTPRQAVAQTPDPCAENQSKELNNMKRRGLEVSNQPKKAESAKCSDRKWSSSSISTTQKAGKSSLLTSATFPGPGLGASSFIAAPSSISPSSRAPGSKLCKEETAKREGNDAVMNDFTYDIWGNHFSEHFFCRPKESMPNLSDPSEGDSYSFFTRGPQPPIMMSVARSAPPGPETPP